MTVKQAIEYLLSIEDKRKENVFTKDTICVGCSKIGSKEQQIKTGKASELLNFKFNQGLHCLIVPGKMHFAEKDCCC